MGTALAVTGALLNYQNEWDNYNAQMEANQKTYHNYVTSMNYSLMNQEMERRDAYESTIDELMNTKLQASRLESQINASVNESMAGRTAGLIKRSVANDTARAIGTIKSNYALKSNEIDLNKERTKLNAVQQIDTIQNPEEPSTLGLFVNLGMAVLQNQQADEERDLLRTKAGVSSSSSLTTTTPKTSVDFYRYPNLGSYNGYSMFDYNRNLTTKRFF